MTSRAKGLLVLLGLLLLPSFISSLESTDDIFDLVLKPKVKVASLKLCADVFLQSSRRTATPLAIKKKLKGVCIDAPLKKKVLKRRFIKDLLAIHDILPRQIYGSTIIVEPEKKSINTKEILTQLLQKEPYRQPQDFRLKYFEPKGISVPKNVLYKLSVLPDNLDAGKKQLNISLLDENNKVVKTLTGSLHLSVYKQGYRLNKNLKAGASISKSDIILSQRYHDNRNDGVIDYSPIGMVVNKKLPKGSLINKTDVELKHFAKGTSMQLVYKTAGIQILLQGKLLSKAQMGEIARFRVLSSNREMKARLIDTNRAEVLSVQ